MDANLSAKIDQSDDRLSTALDRLTSVVERITVITGRNAEAIAESNERLTRIEQAIAGNQNTVNQLIALAAQQQALVDRLTARN